MSCALEQIPLSRSRGLEMGFTGRLNTAFIERAPLTVRNARGSTGSAHLGYGSAVPTPARQSRVVARVLSRMSRPHQALRVAFVQPRERGGKRAAQRYWQRTEALAAGRTNRR